MLKLADLASRADFSAGPLRISPARRQVQGPAGSTSLEPIVMKVFLLLLDARGSVVTRDELFGNAWGGVFVGDDSLNRAMARVRKIAAETAPGLFEIETIPRTGYRLTGEVVASLESSERERAGDLEERGISRRLLIGSGVVTVAMVGGAGLWSTTRPRSPSRFDMLMERGEQIVQNLAATGDRRTIGIFHEAVSIRPDSAKAWGLLGLVTSMASKDAKPEDVSSLVGAAEEAARKALAIDPRQPNALLAMFELKGSTLNWSERDRTLRQIIAIDPGNVVGITELVGLLQSAGLNRESWQWNEHALSIQPLSPDLLGRRALKLWIAGRDAQADKVIDQVRDLYPSYDFVIWIRFIILALSDRTQAAQAMLDTQAAKIGPPLSVALWQSCLPALERRSTATDAKARQACFDAARLGGQLAAQAVMILAAIGEVEAAFEVAQGFLLWRGSVVRRGLAAGQTTNDTQWRNGIQWLFTPPTAVMRADPRFLALCEGVGLTDYWRSRGVRPDYQLAKD